MVYLHAFSHVYFEMYVIVIKYTTAAVILIRIIYIDR